VRRDQLSRVEKVREEIGEETDQSDMIYCADVKRGRKRKVDISREESPLPSFFSPTTGIASMPTGCALPGVSSGQTMSFGSFLHPPTIPSQYYASQSYAAGRREPDGVTMNTRQTDCTVCDEYTRERRRRAYGSARERGGGVLFSRELELQRGVSML
jgi:hypothetical protein